MSTWSNAINPFVKLMNVLHSATDASEIAVAAGIPSSRTRPDDCLVYRPWAAAELPIDIALAIPNVLPGYWPAATGPRRARPPSQPAPMEDLEGSIGRFHKPYPKAGKPSRRGSVLVRAMRIVQPAAVPGAGLGPPLLEHVEAPLQGRPEPAQPPSVGLRRKGVDKGDRALDLVRDRAGVRFREERRTLDANLDGARVRGDLAGPAVVAAPDPQGNPRRRSHLDPRAPTRMQRRGRQGLVRDKATDDHLDLLDRHRDGLDLPAHVDRAASGPK